MPFYRRPSGKVISVLFGLAGGCAWAEWLGPRGPWIALGLVYLGMGLVLLGLVRRCGTWKLYLQTARSRMVLGLTVLSVTNLVIVSWRPEVPPLVIGIVSSVLAILLELVSLVAEKDGEDPTEEVWSQVLDLVRTPAGWATLALAGLALLCAILRVYSTDYAWFVALTIAGTVCAIGALALGIYLLLGGEHLCGCLFIALLVGGLVVVIGLEIRSGRWWIPVVPVLAAVLWIARKRRA